MGAGDDLKKEMHETSPTKLGKKNAFSLNKMQKDSIRHVSDNSEMAMLANQTAKHSLKHYANKNVFQKTINGSFKRKVAVDDILDKKSLEEEAASALEVGRKHFASLASTVRDEDEEYEIKQNRVGSKIIHVKAEIDKIGRRTQ